MKESDANISESLRKLGLPVQEREIVGKKILIIGRCPPSLEPVLESLSQYRRTGSDCFKMTAREIKAGRANGHFMNETPALHAVPVLKKDNLLIAYESIPDENRFDCAFMIGDQAEVEHYLDIFLPLFYRYGPDFRFSTKPLFNYPTSDEDKT
jgi:hypothetical protein